MTPSNERRKKAFLDYAIPGAITFFMLICGFVGNAVLNAITSLTTEVRNLAAEVSTVKAGQVYQQQSTQQLHDELAGLHETDQWIMENMGVRAMPNRSNTARPARR